MSVEIFHAGYILSDDPARLDPVAIHAYLSRSYWAADRSLDVVTRSLAASLCIGIYTETKNQVGLVRVITDYATFAYLCDVYVLEEHRGRSLSKVALGLVKTHSRLRDLKRLHLVTQDAHGLYAQFGFTPLQHPGRHMELRPAN